MQQTRWYVQLFGGLRVSSGGSAAADESAGELERIITRFTTQKTGALLAYLAFHRDRSLPREVLIEMLWPGDNMSAGRHSLSMALSSLRHQLEPPGVPAGAVIVADRQNVGVNRGAVTSDVARFEEALILAAKTTERAARGVRLAEAVALYDGQLLPGYYEEWVSAEQGRLEARFIEAATRLAELREKEGDLAGAVEAAQKAAGADPLREETHVRLFSLMGKAGQTGEALRRYSQFAQLLENETGSGPGSDLRKLLRGFEIRHQETQQAERLVSPAPPIEAPVLVTARNVELAPPTGTVTFLFADTDGESPNDIPHTEKLLAEIVRKNGGYALPLGAGKENGFSLAAAFAAAGDALGAAVNAQRACRDADTWVPAVRMALCTGDVTSAGETASISADFLRQSETAQHTARLLAAGNKGQILVGETTVALLRPPSPQAVSGARFTDLGVFYLGAGEAALPERLFRVEHPDLVPCAKGSPPPPPRARAAYRTNLPLTFTRFFGRETEIHRICEMLREGCRLVTLSGPGGTGKTRLSLQVAEHLTRDFKGEVCFVPLAEATESHQILDAIVLALRLPPQPGSTPLAQIATRFADQSTLLLLDNFEQVTEGATVVQSLLEVVPGVQCLVTSRRLLLLDAEREFMVGPLAVPAASVQRPDQLRLFESVQVFVDRAQAVRPDFQITAHNAPSVAALCERLEGLPLALELAASRAQVLTPAQMLDQLENRFDFLVSRRADRAVRHRSLRTAVEWSYRLLDTQLAHFFAGLSVFRGGFTLDAAETVTGEPLALDYLAQLRECSLVNSAEMDDGTMRFSLLETLREFAQAQVPPEEQDTLSRRHSAFFLAVADKAHAAFATPEQPRALHCLEQENSNLRAALAYLSQSEDVLSHLKLTGELMTFWLVRGFLREGGDNLDAALARMENVDATTDPALLAAQAGATSGAAEIAWTRGDHEKARDLMEKHLALRRQIGDEKGIAVALNNLGNIANGQGDHDTARALYEESLVLSRRIGQTQAIARTLNNLGVLAGSMKDLPRARALFEESLVLRRQVGDPRGIAIALVNLGNILCDQDAIQMARDCYSECLRLCRELGEKNGLGYSLDGFADLANKDGKPVQAARWYGAADALRESTGFQLPTSERERRERSIAVVRAALGEKPFVDAQEAGRALPLADACEQALDS